MRVRDHLEQNNLATGHIDYAARVEEHLARKNAAIKDMQHEAELLELEIVETHKKYVDYNFSYIEPAAKWATMLRTHRNASGEKIDLRKKYPEKVAFQKLEAILAEEFDVDYTGTISTESVVLTEVNDKAAAEGTAEKIEEVRQQLINEEVYVFDTSKFTVDGKTLDSYMADVDTDANFEGDTEVISDGYFHESEYRSAPYFDLKIDGITLLNDAF